MTDEQVALALELLSNAAEAMRGSLDAGRLVAEIDKFIASL